MTKKKVYILLAVAFALSAMLFFVFRYDNEPDTIYVVTNENPMNYHFSDSVIDGYNYCMMRAIADSLGMKLDVTVDDHSMRRYWQLRSGRYDIMLNLVPVTTASVRDYIFTKPVLIGHLVLVQRTDSLRVSGIDQLDGKIIYIEDGSYYTMVLDDLQEELGINFKVKQVPRCDYEDICSMVSDGRIDYAAVLSHSANMAQHEYDNLDVSLDLGFNQFFAWPVSNKKSRLKSQIDSLLLTSFSFSHMDM